MTLEIITSEVLKLDRLQRIELLQLVFESIAIEERVASAAEGDPGLTPEQAAEIDRRLALFEAGAMETTPANKVMANLIEKHGLQR